MMEELREVRKEQRKCSSTRRKILLFIVNVFVFETIIMKVSELFNWSVILQSAPIFKTVLLAVIATGLVWKFWERLKESVFLAIAGYFLLACVIDFVLTGIAMECFGITNMFILFFLTVASFWIDMFLMMGLQHITKYVRTTLSSKEIEI